MGKVVLVTGGSRGIGKAVVLEFASKGYNVVINCRKKGNELDEFKGELEKLKVRVMFVEGDVTDFARWEQIAKDVIEEFGRIDVLVNNAGITKDTLLLRMKEDDFDKVLNVNLKGTFNVTKAIIPHMAKRRCGRIINLSSIVGEVGNAGQANYAASKAGIVGFTKSCAREFAARNILVNSVAPGFVKTDMTEVLSDEVKENINGQIPLKRQGEPSEIAKLVYFLGSDENTYITGQSIGINGGMCM